MTLGEVQSLFMTNLFSVMLLCKEFAPLLIASRGKIVNIGSVAGIIPCANLLMLTTEILTGDL